MKVFIGRYPKHHTTERKIRVQIDKYDTWSLDHTLAVVIAPALKAFKADPSLGTPGSMWPENYDWALGQDDEADKNIHQTAHDRWLEIIDKMIFAFESIAEGTWEDQFYTHPDDGEEAWSDDKSFNEHLSKIKFDKEGYEAYQARINEGLALFARYYQNLWT